MVEQIKIGKLLGQWNFLNLYQLSALTNKKAEAIRSIMRQLQRKKIVKITLDGVTKKTYYVLTRKGESFFNDRLVVKKKNINLQELVHNELLISWLTHQKWVKEYKTQRDLQTEMQTWPLDFDLLITNQKEELCLVKLEDSENFPTKFKDKISELQKLLIENNFPSGQQFIEILKTEIH